MAVVCYQAARGSFDLAPRPDAPAGFPSGVWRRIGEGKSWSRDDFYKIRGLAFHDGRLYASLTGPRQDGNRGEVWSWDGSMWALEGGGDRSWPAEPSFVDHLFAHGGSLYAAVGSRVWRRAANGWQVAAEVADDTRAGAYCFAEHNGRMMIGRWGAPAVFALDDAGRLEALPEPRHGWGKVARTIYCLQSFEGALYAATGTGRLSGEASSVFRFDGKGWEKIGGGGVRGSWAEDGIAFVLALTTFKGMLVATLSRRPGTAGAASSVWAFDGTEWRPVGVGLTPAEMGRATILNDAIEYQGRLIVATGGSDGREAGAFSFERNGWLNIADDAFAPETPSENCGYWIYRLASDGQRLYAGAAGHTGAASLFEFTPADRQ